jgi:hypothetical protein
LVPKWPKVDILFKEEKNDLSPLVKLTAKTKTVQNCSVAIGVGIFVLRSTGRRRNRK